MFHGASPKTLIHNKHNKMTTLCFLVCKAFSDTDSSLFLTFWLSYDVFIGNVVKCSIRQSSTLLSKYTMTAYTQNHNTSCIM